MYDKPAARKNAVWQRCMQTWQKIMRQREGAEVMDQIMKERVDLLEQWIRESDNVVFFGGAGVSTESGIPDFRSVDGLYNQQYDYPPETIISHSFYRRNPEEFYRFYKNKMLFPEAKPNAAHLALAKLEQQEKVRAVITQNIDGLHQAAGTAWFCPQKLLHPLWKIL